MAAIPTPPRVARPPPPWRRLWWLPVSALLLAWLATLTPAHTRLGDAFSDTAMRWTAQPAQFDELAVVDIDDASLRALAPRLGEWPFQRDSYALLIDYLRDAGARAIVFDIVFVGPRQGDDRLARSLAKRNDVVLAASGLRRAVEDSASARADIDRLSTGAVPTGHGTRWPAVALPAPPLLAALQRPGALGIISMPLDADGQLRRVPLMQEVDGRVLPSLPLASQLIAFGYEKNANPTEPAAAVFSVTANAVHVGSRHWPVDAQGMTTLVLPKNSDAVRTFKFDAVMHAALGIENDMALRTAFGGRTVYIGSSAFLGDNVITPLGLRSGAAVLAMTDGALARNHVLQPASAPLQSALLLLALLPCGWLLWRGRPALGRDALATLLVGLAIVGIALMGAAGSFGRLQQIDVAEPVWVLLFAAGLMAATQLRWTAEANRRLEQERAIAEASNRAKTAFLASVSHEIRTPLNAVLGMADVLSRTELSADQRSYVDVFRSSGATLCRLINDLLDLSKIDAGKLEIDRSVFALQPLLAEQMALLQPQAAAKGIAFTCHVDPAVGLHIECDRQRLAQALLNLAANALKFTQHGTVSIDVQRASARQLRFEVSDTGIGIDAGKLEMIFQPFTQADGSITRAYGGTGLGLSITKSLVELMGGQIEVASQVGSGSVFRFTVDAPEAVIAPQPLAPPRVVIAPAAPKAGDLHGNAAMLNAVSQQSNGSSRNGAADALGAAVPTLPILLVDDNEVNLIVTEALLRETGYAVEIARDAEVALDLFRTARFGLMLMDVQMPGMDGLAATREIRRLEAAEGRERTPIVALTANAFDTDERSSLDAGCDAHLTKPVNRQRLLDTVASLGRHLPPAIVSAVTTAQAGGQALAAPPIAADAEPATAAATATALTDAIARGRLH
jgi:signal transduction histidine kinase/CheY-like chemotaxis protein